MAVRVWMKGSGVAYHLDAAHDDVVRAWRAAVVGEGDPFGTYRRLYAGIPKPEVTLDLREVSSVEQETL